MGCSRSLDGQNWSSGSFTILSIPEARIAIVVGAEAWNAQSHLEDPLGMVILFPWTVPHR